MPTLLWKGLDLDFGAVQPKKAVVVERLRCALVRHPFWGAEAGVVSSKMLFQKAKRSRRECWITHLLQRVMVRVYGERERSNQGRMRQQLELAWRRAASRKRVRERERRDWQRRASVPVSAIGPTIVLRLKTKFQRLVRKGRAFTAQSCEVWWHQQMRKRRCFDQLLHRRIRWSMRYYDEHRQLQLANANGNVGGDANA